MLSAAEAIITYYLTLLVWFCLVSKTNNQSSKTQHCLKCCSHTTISKPINLKSSDISNMEAPTSSDNSEPACQFSSPLLPFTECAPKLLHFFSVTNCCANQNPVSSITSSKKITAYQLLTICHLDCYFLGFYFGNSSY